MQNLIKYSFEILLATYSTFVITVCTIAIL